MKKVYFLLCYMPTVGQREGKGRAKGGQVLYFTLFSLWDAGLWEFSTWILLVMVVGEREINITHQPLKASAWKRHVISCTFY